MIKTTFLGHFLRNRQTHRQTHRKVFLQSCIAAANKVKNIEPPSEENVPKNLSVTDRLTDRLTHSLTHRKVFLQSCIAAAKNRTLCEFKALIMLHLLLKKLEKNNEPFQK